MNEREKQNYLSKKAEHRSFLLTSVNTTHKYNKDHSNQQLFPLSRPETEEAMVTYYQREHRYNNRGALSKSDVKNLMKFRLTLNNAMIISEELTMLTMLKSPPKYLA